MAFMSEQGLRSKNYSLEPGSHMLSLKRLHIFLTQTLVVGLYSSLIKLLSYFHHRGLVYITLTMKAADTRTIYFLSALAPLMRMAF